MIVLIFEENEEVYLNKLLSILKNQHLAMKICTETKNILSFPDLMIIPNQQRVLFKNKEEVLTHTEFCILLFMAQRPRQVFSHCQLYDAVYEQVYGMNGVDNIIYGIVKELRKKIGADPRHPRYIHTVRGVGYKFEAIPEECD